MRVLVSQIGRYAGLGLAGSVLVILSAMAGIVVASTYLPFPEAVFVGGYGGMVVVLLACGGFYELGRRDGADQAVEQLAGEDVVRVDQVSGLESLVRRPVGALQGDTGLLPLVRPRSGFVVVVKDPTTVSAGDLLRTTVV